MIFWLLNIPIEHLNQLLCMWLWNCWLILVPVVLWMHGSSVGSCDFCWFDWGFYLGVILDYDLYKLLFNNSDALTLVHLVFAGSTLSRLSDRELWQSCRDEHTEKPPGSDKASDICEADLWLPFAAQGCYFPRCKGRRACPSCMCKNSEQGARGLPASDWILG